MSLKWTGETEQPSTQDNSSMEVSYSLPLARAHNGPIKSSHGGRDGNCIRT